MSMSDKTKKCFFPNYLEPGTYDIGFINDEGNPDETQFDAENADELAQLWVDFCEDEGIDPDSSIQYVEQGYDPESPYATEGVA